MAGNLRCAFSSWVLAGWPRSPRTETQPDLELGAAHFPVARGRHDQAQAPRLGGALFTVNACEDFALWIKDEAKWDGIEVVLTGGCFFSESQHTIMLWVRAGKLLNAAIAVRKAECNFKQMLPKHLCA